MKRQNGFTLVELMISLVLAALITFVLFTVFRGQQRAFQAQTEVAQMQQTIRAAMEVLTRDLHNLGVDSTNSGLYGFSTDTPPTFPTLTQLFFTADLNEDGGAALNNDPDGPNGPLRNETFEYALFDCDNAIDFDGDGNLTTDNDCLRRRRLGGTRIADNIEALEFRYLLSDGVTDVVNPVTTAQLNSIAFVEVSMLVRANNPDPDYDDGSVGGVGGVLYTMGSGNIYGTAAFPKTAVAGTNPENYRRRLIVSRVRLRNQ